MYIVSFPDQRKKVAYTSCSAGMWGVKLERLIALHDRVAPCDWHVVYHPLMHVGFMNPFTLRAVYAIPSLRSGMHITRKRFSKSAVPRKSVVSLPILLMSMSEREHSRLW